jgi:hypothetical protein
LNHPFAAQACAVDGDGGRRDACEAHVATTLVALARSAAPGAIRWAPPPGATASPREPTCVLEFGAATEWFERGPVHLEVLRQSATPLVAVSDCDVPNTVQVCLAMFDRDSLSTTWVVCDSEDFAGHEALELGHRGFVVEATGRTRSIVAIPWETFSFTCKSRCALAVFARDAETQSAFSAAARRFATGDRGVVSVAPLSPVDVFEAPFAGTTRVFDETERGGSYAKVADQPSFPFQSRHSELRRVGYDPKTQELVFFAPDGGAGDLPEVLGKPRRPGLSFAGFRGARVSSETYAEFKRRQRCITHERAVAATLVQPPGNQFHALTTTLAPLLAYAGGKPALFLNDWAHADALFTGDGGELVRSGVSAELVRRERRQYDAFFDTKLWADARGQRLCFEALTVGYDERDSLNGFVYASNGLVVTSAHAARAPATSQFARSARSLRRLRDELSAAFAPPGAYDGPRSETTKVLVVERPKTRNFKSTAAVLEEVRRGCFEATRSSCDVEPVDLERLSYEAQIAKLAAAHALVGVEGMGLANMLYLRANSSVVVLVPAGFDEAAVDYVSMAALLGLRVESTLLLASPRRPSLHGNREADLSEKGYWTNRTNDLVFAPGVVAGAGQESEIPNFKASYLGRFPLVSADFWTSDHLSERPRRVGAFSGTRARGTLTLKRR